MTPTPAPAASILIELTRRGIELQAHEGKLRYRPRSKVTPDLIKRLKSHKGELLAILANYATHGSHERPTGPQRATNAVGGMLQADAVPTGAAKWLCGDANGLPAGVVDLARPRDGWTPAAWHGRLLQLADRCDRQNPERAAELRLAGIAMTPDCLEEYQERAGIMEYDGELPRPQAEAQALTDTAARLRAAKNTRKDLDIRLDTGMSSVISWDA